MSNSVRMMAPVGQTSRQPAWTQCLQTSLIMQPARRCGPVVAELLDELDVAPVDRRRAGGCCRSCRRSACCAPPSVAGSWFHSLQATSHALQPMQTVVSVKKPIGCGAWQVASAGPGTGDWARAESCGLEPGCAHCAQLTHASHAFSTLHTNALPSCIETFGSPTSASGRSRCRR